MNTQQAQTKFSKKQIFIATLLTELVIGVGAGCLHPLLGIATDAVFAIAHVVTYKEQNKDE